MVDNCKWLKPLDLLPVWVHLWFDKCLGEAGGGEARKLASGRVQLGACLIKCKLNPHISYASSSHVVYN